MFEEGLNLLPCPHCGKPATLWAVDMSEGVYVFCDNCGMRGPLTEEMTEHAAITAWNALPRKLRFSREKPTQDGKWYWYRDTEGEPAIGFLRDGCLTFLGGSYVYIDNAPGEFAGPIPELEESHDTAE